MHRMETNNHVSISTAAAKKCSASTRTAVVYTAGACYITCTFTYTRIYLAVGIPGTTSVFLHPKCHTSVVERDGMGKIWKVGG